MDEFPSNSHASRNRATESPEPANTHTDPQKVVLDPVVTGKVIRRKKSVFTRISETLFRGESSVLGYLLQEVLVPALKDMATSMVTQGIEKAMYGEVRSPRGTARGYSPSVGRTHVSYDRAGSVRPGGLAPSGRRPVTQSSAAQVEDVIVATKIEAQEIIDTLFRTVDTYGQATVANLNDLIRQTSFHTDHNWGWTNLDDLTARRVSGGYLILLPPTEPLR